MTTEAQRLRCGRDQLNAGHIPVDPNLVAAQATGRDRRVDRLPFAFVFVALEALGRIHVLFERNWVSLRQAEADRADQEADNPQEIEEVAFASFQCLVGLMLSAC